MNEGEDKVKTDSVTYLYLILTFPVGGEKWRGVGLCVQLQPYLPVGWRWAGQLLPFVGVGGCHFMSAPDT